MAKIIDNIISKVGTDKVLHFLIGAVVCAIVTFVFLTQETSLTGWRTALTPLSGTLFTLMAAWIKEGYESFRCKQVVVECFDSQQWSC